MIVDEAIITLQKAGFEAVINSKFSDFSGDYIAGGILGDPVPGLPKYRLDWFYIGPKRNIWVLNYSPHTATNREEQDEEVPIEHQTNSLEDAVNLIIELYQQGKYPHKVVY